MKREKSALRRYVESFDQETMMETARWVGVVWWLCGVDCHLGVGMGGARCRLRRPQHLILLWERQG